jgi:hypothetical protein
MSLWSLLRPCFSPEAVAWLDAIDFSDPSAASRAFSVAPRHVETDSVASRPPLPWGYEWLGAGSTADELARIAILSRAAEVASSPVALATEWHDRGDNRERRAVLRSLSLLPDPPSFAFLAVAACRTSVQPVFEAIACENPFPATYLPEAAFNQMVLKAFFTGVEVDRIVGLDGRRNPDLDRMARDYAAERRAAGRPLPADLDRVLAPG